MVRTLVIAIISILLYNTASFIYVFSYYPSYQNEYYMGEEMKWLKFRISSELALKRNVNLSDIFEGAQEACLTGIDVNPLDWAKDRGARDVDYYFGVLGVLDWADASTYIVVFRDDKKATIVMPDYFYIEESFGGCAKEKIILRVDNVGVLSFESGEDK